MEPTKARPKPTRVVGVRLPDETYREVKVAQLRFPDLGISTNTDFMVQAIDRLLADLRLAYNEGQPLV